MTATNCTDSRARRLGTKTVMVGLAAAAFRRDRRRNRQRRRPRVGQHHPDPRHLVGRQVLGGEGPDTDPRTQERAPVRRRDEPGPRF
jgi:hypothetical protein